MMDFRLAKTNINKKKMGGRRHISPPGKDGVPSGFSAVRTKYAGRQSRVSITRLTMIEDGLVLRGLGFMDLPIWESVTIVSLLNE